MSVSHVVLKKPLTTAEIAESWKFDHVRIFLHERENVSMSRIDEMQEEYLRYMQLVAENQGIKLPVSPPVDEFWHIHILFTRDYSRFSQAMIGGYIHHMPALTQSERIAMAPRYLETLNLYENKFGEAPEKWWPRDCICSSCTGPGGGCD